MDIMIVKNTHIKRWDTFTRYNCECVGGDIV